MSRRIARIAASILFALALTAAAASASRALDPVDPQLAVAIPIVEEE